MSALLCETFVDSRHFSGNQTYSVTNGLAPAAATAKTKDDKQEDNEDNNPPDPAPAAAAKTAAGVAAAVIAAAVVVAASASIVTVVVAAAATGRYLLFSHGKNLLKICNCVKSFAAVCQQANNHLISQRITINIKIFSK